MDFDFHPTSSQGITLAAGASVAALFLINRWASSGLDAIPTLGYSNPVLSYIDAYKYYFGNAVGMVHEGYMKYPNSIFKIANPRCWAVIVTGGSLIDELRNAPRESLSMPDGLAEMTHTDYTFGECVRTDTYHSTVLKGVMTRQLAVKFPEMYDEISQAFHDNLTVTDEWKPVHAYMLAMELVARGCHRVFVGLPMCRDPELLKMGIDFATHAVPLIDLMTGSPQFLRPIIGLFKSTKNKDRQRAIKLLGPIVSERFKQEAEYGKDWDRPNDLLTWLMDESQGPEHTVENVAARFLPIQFGAIHTMTMGLVHALYYLASQPEYIKPLREEATRVIAEHGWTKTAMQEMYKIDSFLMESARLNPIGAIMMDRKVVKDFKFSNGIILPKGTMVSVSVNDIHHDSTIYSNALEFDPFRFSRLREGLNADKDKNQWASLAKSYYSFGSGRHACPGRFLAVLELKCIMAYLVMHYDVKAEVDGIRPPNVWAGARCEPSNDANIMLRLRQK
ncbi:cytochrome P450 [Flagelloscypha sp. PMI_526]|nr:cytochrome P450 [Flagelloscypha sp. PMI_526]